MYAFQEHKTGLVWFCFVLLLHTTENLEKEERKLSINMLTTSVRHAASLCWPDSLMTGIERVSHYC